MRENETPNKLNYADSFLKSNFVFLHFPKSLLAFTKLRLVKGRLYVRHSAGIELTTYFMTNLLGAQTFIKINLIRPNAKSL